MQRILLSMTLVLGTTGIFSQTIQKNKPKPLPIGVIDMGNEKQKGGNILPYPISRKTLPNGLNVVTVKFDSPGLAAFYIVVRVGSRNEIEEGKTGFAHFFEHMMFRGTDRYSKDAYDKVLK